MSRSTKVHYTILCAYIALTPISYVMGWLSSVTYVSLLSLWALVESRLAALEASKAKYCLEGTTSEPDPSSDAASEAEG